jgi:CubicO group peptidase (beta-lactamase class C family)
MANWPRVVTHVAVIAGVCLAGCRAKDPSDEPPVDDLSDIPALMDYFGVPGVSIAIIRDFKVEQLLVYGVASTSTGEAVTEDTLFGAASISKSITAVAAMRLAQAGRLDLDADVNDLLQTWQVPGNDLTQQQPVTTRRLLSHTGGLAAIEFEGYEATEKLPTLEQILNGTPPANSPAAVVDVLPGTQFQYSNVGYECLQQLLIDVSEQPFTDLVQASVIAPAGMTHSTFAQPLPPEIAQMASAGHQADGQVVTGNARVYPELAAAGLWTTAEDLALFLVEMQQALRGHSSRMLDQRTAESMVAPIEEGGYGLGLRLWRMGDDVYFGHDGSIAGFNSLMYGHAEAGVGVVVLTNSDNGTALEKRIPALVGHLEGWPGY